LTAEQREREEKKRNDGPADTLARKLGTEHDIKMLFGALAAAAGFEVRAAAGVDRSQIFFDESFLNWYFMDQRLVAVHVGSEWRFYDPGAADLPPGMLPWGNEGVRVLVADAKQPFFVETPISLPERSAARRQARFKLDAEGTLEGDVSISYTGHHGRRERLLFVNLSPEKRAEELIDLVRKRLPAASVSAPVFEGTDEPDKPFTIRYHVRLPQYAERTGARLFFEPGYFEKGTTARFSAALRQHPVCFSFPWSEEDDVSFELPSGFVPESTEGIAPLSAGPVGGYSAKMGVTQGTPTTFVRSRKLWFGGGGHVMFDSTQYAPIKGFFDAVHRSDTRTVALKQASK
jgi:hypothetical protein